MSEWNEGIPRTIERGPKRRALDLRFSSHTFMRVPGRRVLVDVYRDAAFGPEHGGRIAYGVIRWEGGGVRMEQVEIDSVLEPSWESLVTVARSEVRARYLEIESRREVVEVLIVLSHAPHVDPCCSTWSDRWDPVYESA